MPLVIKAWTLHMTSTVLPKCLRLDPIAELDMLQLDTHVSVACQTPIIDCTLNFGAVARQHRRAITNLRSLVRESGCHLEILLPRVLKYQLILLFFFTSTLLLPTLGGRMRTHGKVALPIIGVVEQVDDGLC
jgi:hypothetical protein